MVDINGRHYEKMCQLIMLKISEDHVNDITFSLGHQSKG